VAQLKSAIVRELSRLVGGRDAGWAKEFMEDCASRISNRVQITTDGHRSYLEAVEGAFGMDVDYAQLQKIYGAAMENETRYSPAKCIDGLGMYATEGTALDPVATYDCLGAGAYLGHYIVRPQYRSGMGSGRSICLSDDCAAAHKGIRPRLWRVQ
jgi:hypothetical protein